MTTKQNRTADAAPIEAFEPTHGGVYRVESGKVKTLEGGVKTEAAPADAAAPATPGEGA